VNVVGILMYLTLFEVNVSEITEISQWCTKSLCR